VLCASPAYLKRAGVPRTPEALARHACVAFSGTTPNAERWAFARPGAGRRERTVHVHPRLVVNTAQAAIDAAVAGLGIVRLISYQVAPLLADKKLQVVLAAHERPAFPVHLVHPAGPQPRVVGAFLDLAAEKISARLA
jgi:DNA-binding transcriptional LysR family regulator